MNDVENVKDATRIDAMECDSKEEIKANDELLEKIEKAAEKGAGRGFRKSRIIISVVLVVIIVAAGAIAFSSIKTSISSLKEQVVSVLDQFKFDNNADEHDLVVNNNGILGYTAADFAEAILGNSSRVKKLEVYQQEVSDLVTITDTGLFNLGIFTKSQYLTYHGTATYTVDLSALSEDSITLDNNERIVYVSIPHPQLEKINIPESEIEVSDTTKGILAFGEIKMTQEEAAKVQAEARSKMEEELTNCNAAETADRMAILSVWEMYAPIVRSIAKGYTLQVQFCD